MDVEKFIQQKERGKEIAEQIFAKREREIEPEMMEAIGDALVIVPKDVVDYVADNVTFRSPHTFTDKDGVLDGGIITLFPPFSEIGNRQSSSEHILHEVAHAFLRHKKNTTPEEHAEQEHYARQLVLEWKIASDN